MVLSVPVSDIKSVVTGKDCPHMKEKSALKQNKVLLVYLLIILYCHLSHKAVLSFFAVTEYGVCRHVCFSQEVLELAFSVLYDPDETLNFVAPNKYEVSSETVRPQATIFEINLNNGSNVFNTSI